MGKIIGEQFREYVVSQINQRQLAHGSGTDGSRTMDQLTYLNSKTAWVKLASGVFVSGSRAETEGIGFGNSGTTLAKKNILFGGTSDIYNSDVLQQRGTDDNNNLNIADNRWGTYNVTPTDIPSEFGLVPMPGITSVDVKSMNRGSIRKATVNLKCYSPEQFKIIDLLYLRLGYTVFLEYGNSLYLDDKGKLQTQKHTLIEDERGFFSDIYKESSYSAFLPAIERFRARRHGNYDGMLAKVVNFSWTFAQDGSYDITLELISLGDVVESLKINISPSYDTSIFIKSAYALYSEDTSTAKTTESEDLTSSPANNVITSYLFQQKLFLDGNINKSTTGTTGTQRIENKQVTIKIGGDTLKMGGTFVYPPKDGIIKLDPIYTDSEVFDTEQQVHDFIKSEYNGYTDVGNSLGIDFDNNFKIAFSTTNSYVVLSNWSGFDYFARIKTIPETFKTGTNNATRGDVVYLSYNEGQDDQDAPINDAGFYMRWGHLLRFINDKVIPVIKGTTPGNPTKIVGIDYGTWTNKMYTLPYHVSLDPRVCIVKSLDNINSKEYYQELDDFKNAKFDYAWPMNIYLSHNQIIASLNENLDEKGNIALFDFLNSLCIAVNKAMGGINNLEPFLDEDKNILHIVDASYQKEIEDKYPYTLQLYGYDKNESGFVRNFNLKTEITNDFATMASIGSTAGGYIKGVENTMFSKWNKGLIDRWKEEYEAADEDSRPKPGEEPEPNKMYVEEFWNKRYSPFGYTLMDVANDTSWFGIGEFTALNDDLIDSNIEIVTEFYKFIQAKIQEEKQGKYSSPSNGFIPINLGITMDGISGIKIYNEVNVDTRFLPSNYPDSLRFIIKGVNHKLSDSDWETTLETVVIAKTSDESNKPLTQIEIKEIMDKYIQGAVVSSGGNGGSGGSQQNPTGNNSNQSPQIPPNTQSGVKAKKVDGKGVKTYGTLGKSGNIKELSPDALSISNIAAIVNETKSQTTSILRGRIVEIAASYAGNQEALPPQNPGWWDSDYEAKFKGLIPSWYPTGKWCVWFCQLVWKEAYTTGNKLVPNTSTTGLAIEYLSIWNTQLKKGALIGAGSSTIKENFQKIGKFITIEQVTSGKYKVQPGDIAVFNGHAEIVIKPFYNNNGKYTGYSSIGGNTGKEDATNGGETRYYPQGMGTGSPLGFCKVITPIDKNKKYT